MLSSTTVASRGLMPLRGAAFRGRRTMRVCAAAFDGKKFFDAARERSSQFIKKLDVFSRPIAEEIDTMARDDVNKIVEWTKNVGSNDENENVANTEKRRIWKAVEKDNYGYESAIVDTDSNARKE